jgi:tRNA A-37 threonylcarbamoyl transferase component Bud32
MRRAHVSVHAWPEISAASAAGDSFSYVHDRWLAGRVPNFEGHYNVAYRVMWEGRPALVRRPKSVDRGFDPRMMTEREALQAAATAGVRSARLLHNGRDFLVIEFIEQPVAEVVRSGWTVWYEDLLDQAGTMHARSRSTSEIRNVLDWQRWLWTFHDSLYGAVARRYGHCIEQIGLPALEHMWPRDTVIVSEASCPEVTLLHSDLHPDNLLTDGERVWILDWELALVGDPVWDAATSLHRTNWIQSEDESVAREMWLAALARTGRLNAESTLELYRRLEVWKSLVVDTVRYQQVFARAESAEVDRVVASYVMKLERAADFLPLKPRDETGVRELFTMWARSDDLAG